MVGGWTWKALKKPKQMSSKQMAHHRLLQQIYTQQAQTQSHLQQQAQTQQALIQAMQGNSWLSPNATSTPTLGALGLYTNTASTATVTTGTASGIAWVTNGGVGFPPEAVFDDPYAQPHYAIREGRPIELRLPDGTVIDVKADGSFTINDKDAKVTYRANRVRDFNSYINASDKLEAFIKFCGAAGVRQDEMLDIPVKHFIAWLIVEAAKADGEAEPATAIPALPPPQTRCRCGRFISRKLTARKIAFCRPVCLERELEAA